MSNGIVKKPRDFVKELEVQKNLERQLSTRKKLLELRKKNVILAKQLHPTPKSRAKKILRLLGKETVIGLKEARKGLKKYKKERRKGKRFSEIIGIR